MDLRPPRSGVSHPFRSTRPVLVSRIDRKPGSTGGLRFPRLPPARLPRANQMTRGGDADIGLHRASSNRYIVPDPGAQNQIEAPVSCTRVPGARCQGGPDSIRSISTQPRPGMASRFVCPHLTQDVPISRGTGSVCRRLSADVPDMRLPILRSWSPARTAPWGASR